MWGRGGSFANTGGRSGVSDGGRPRATLSEYPSRLASRQRATWWQRGRGARDDEGGRWQRPGGTGRWATASLVSAYAYTGAPTVGVMSSCGVWYYVLYVILRVRIELELWTYCRDMWVPPFDCRAECSLFGAGPCSAREYSFIHSSVSFSLRPTATPTTEHTVGPHTLPVYRHTRAGHRVLCDIHHTHRRYMRAL